MLQVRSQLIVEQILLSCAEILLEIEGFFNIFIKL
jgi:hypothetical protein